RASSSSTSPKRTWCATASSNSSSKPTRRTRARARFEMPISPLTIAAGAWLWEKYGKTVVDKTAGAVKGGWEKFRWNDAAEKYRAKIKKLYGTMQIMGMAAPVPLDDIFTEAYMLDKPTAFGRFDIERLKQLSSDPEAPPPNAKRVAGLTLVNKNKNL